MADALATMLEACAPHAEVLGCTQELAAAEALAERPGADRQRALAERTEGLHGVLAAMHGDFASREPVAA